MPKNPEAWPRITTSIQQQQQQKKILKIIQKKIAIKVLLGGDVKTGDDRGRI